MKMINGGYKCGDDGKWTQTCQISYCDIGYYYDKKLNKCEIDKCTNSESKDDDDEPKGLQGWVIAVIVIGALIVLAVLFLIIWKFVIANKPNSDEVGVLVEKDSEMKELVEQN